MFTGTWQYGGAVEHVTKPGDFATSQAGHVPIVIVRGRDGELRGFVNVCRHRGHLVASDSGCRETLQCPYHAWTYDLDGSRASAPRSDREPGFDPGDFLLASGCGRHVGPVRVRQPGCRELPPLHTVLGRPAPARGTSAASTCMLPLPLAPPVASQSNWKVAMENYLECYHCAVAHPGFSKLIDVSPDRTGCSLRPTYTSQIGPVRQSALGATARRRTTRMATSPRPSSTTSGRTRRSTSHQVPQNLSIERGGPTGPKSGSR